MKKTTIIALLLAGQMGAMAQSINFHMTDGTVVTLNSSEIDHIDFLEAEKGFCPDVNHPHMIDLGVGILWSCCNVGASSPEEYGGYYAWGETKVKSSYSAENYAYFDSSNYSYDDLGTEISGTGYDAATANWGAPWQLPTFEQIKTLVMNCTCLCVQLNGVDGVKFTGPNGNSIFMPLAGYWMGAQFYGEGRSGYYRCGTSNPNDIGFTYGLLFDNSGYASWLQAGRCDGYSVRAVAKDSE